MPEETPLAAVEGSYAPEAVERTPPIARVVTGTIVGLGLYLGLRKLSAGFVLAILHEAESWWQSSEALTAIFILQLVACGFGALLASAGRTRGIALGAGVGILCGGLFLGAEAVDGTPPTQLVFLLQPVLITICAAIAGAVGSWVWAAVPELDMPAPLVKKSSSIELLQEKPKHAERPTKWLRVIVGSIVIVAGMGLAEKARFAAEKASGGVLRVESRGQGKFMSWQIATLAVLVGGAFAGANTGAGLRHGVFAGLLGAVGGGALTMMRGEFTQPEEYLLKYMNLAVAGPGDPVAVLGIGFGILVATLVGGWFGGQLFPPLAPAHMRRPHLYGLD